MAYKINWEEEERLTEKIMNDYGKKWNQNDLNRRIEEDMGIVGDKMKKEFFFFIIKENNIKYVKDPKNGYKNLVTYRDVVKMIKMDIIIKFRQEYICEDAL